MKQVKKIEFIFLVLVLVFVYTQRLAAQEKEPKKNENFEDLIEEIAANSEEELDYTVLLDELNYFYQHPLNLNTATRDDLEKMQFLNTIQINNLLDYINKHGPMLSLYELHVIEGFTYEDIQQMLPFVEVGEAQKHKFNWKNTFRYGQHQLFLRSRFTLQEQAGYKEIPDSVLAEDPDKNRYLGSKYKLYTRYIFRYSDHVKWGITAEKDPGEEFFTGNQPQGFDYYSAHLEVNDIGIVKSAVVGDYQMQFGQGLVLWSGMSMGKSSYILNINKNARGLRKYSSTNENIFMRGAGTTLSIGNFEITGFYSKKSIDANISSVDTLEDEIQEVSSFQTTGYHTTPNEIEDKDAIKETITGGNISFNSRFFKGGLTLANYRFSAPLNKKESDYNQFEFQGTENTNAGFNYQFQLDNITVFGETALSQNKAFATVNGTLMKLAPQVSFAMLHRYYEPEYQALYANAFGENSQTANENGIYTGIEFHPVAYWSVKAYFDTFRFPWLRFRTDAPSHGKEYMVEVNYHTSRQLQMYCRLKHETKQENLITDDISPVNLAAVDKLKIRYHITWQANELFRLKNRIEMARYKKGSESAEKGFMIYQDITYTPRKIPLKIDFRYAVFNTDSYNTRIYAYENDVLYGFSIPAYYSKGIRTYLNLRYSFTQAIDLWLRYAITRYHDKKVIGSGLTEINGNKKSQVKIQLRFKF